METSVCNVIYVDRGAHEDSVIRAASLSGGAVARPAGAVDDEPPRVNDNIRVLLEAFGDVQLCASGASCISKIFELHDASTIDHKPTIVLIDTPHDEPVPGENGPSRSPSPYSDRSWRHGDGAGSENSADDSMYGLRLLQRIATEAHVRSLSKVVVPIPVIRCPALDPLEADGEVVGHAKETTEGAPVPALSDTGRANRPRLVQRCLEMGATDVLTSPLHNKSILTLEVIAYRAHKAAIKDQQALLEVRKGRKRSWVGVDGEKPFAYLREAMVSTLMSGICRMGDEEDSRVDGLKVSVAPERRARIAEAVGKWHFNAHDFSDDELVVAATVMFGHALAMPELEHWRIPADQLTRYLLACRAAYNSFVPYHNFRHVVDVLQATFHFLVSLRILPAYPVTSGSSAASSPKSPMAALLHPFEALTLLITAIGHDVGHPGVNNGFLITLNAPLAQLYNDRSVLEAFHCAAYSQILRRHWPSVFEDRKMRNLMISSILATDMGLHFDYMKKLSDVQEKLNANNTTQGWNGRMLEEQKALVCCLLIKCADISNVAREHKAALIWMHILSDEFARQASMETELDIPSALMAPPLKETIAMSRAQLNFMALFAFPLFQGVVDILPPLKYTVEEMDLNKRLFEKKIAEAQARGSPERKPAREETASPITTDSTTTLKAEKDRPSLQPVTSTVVADQKHNPASLREFSPKPADPANKPSHVPQVAGQYKEVNGMVTSFEAVADFAASDPFSINQGQKYGEGKQRHSDTTDASGSIPGTGDSVSQATSTTTGRMPLSPSTQGTSLVSRDSMERPGSRPVATITAPPDSAKSMSDTRIDSPPAVPDDDTSSNSKSSGDKALKKRPSRFRMNAFPFFRRHKSPSPAAEPI